MTSETSASDDMASDICRALPFHQIRHREQRVTLPCDVHHRPLEPVPHSRSFSVLLLVALSRNLISHLPLKDALKLSRMGTNVTLCASKLSMSSKNLTRLERAARYPLQLISSACIVPCHSATNPAPRHQPPAQRNSRIRQAGSLPGLTVSNELISRDERLHRHFACLQYSHASVKLAPSRSTVLQEIVKSAVAITKDNRFHVQFNVSCVVPVATHDLPGQYTSCVTLKQRPVFHTRK